MCKHTHTFVQTHAHTQSPADPELVHERLAVEHVFESGHQLAVDRLVQRVSGGRLLHRDGNALMLLQVVKPRNDMDRLLEQRGELAELLVQKYKY